MAKKYQVLDASAFIGEFSAEDAINFTVPEVSEELKDFKSRFLMENLIKAGKLLIEEPDEEDLQELDRTIKNSGDNLRLSSTDKKLLGLALTIKKRYGKVKVITDDYSMQNVLKIWKIPFKSILTPGIQEIFTWKKICQGCKKQFPETYADDECDVCGSKIYKKRFKSI